MKFGSALLSASFLASPALAASGSNNGDVKIFDGSVSTESKLGQRIMSKARNLNENNYYTRWMADYSIKFDGCVSVPAFEREEGLSANILAKFKLCPSDKCSSCPNAGEYAVELREFVETFQEAQREANEYACETQEQTCEYQCQNGQYNYNNGNGNNNNNNQNNNNNGDNEDYCKYQCLVDAGMSYCGDGGGGDEQMDMQEFAECRPMDEEQNNNNNNGYNNGNYQMYYTGAYCTSDGIYAALFMDSACSKQAPDGTYEKMNYGYSLPTESMIEVGCQSCKVNNYNNNNNNNNNGENNNNNNQNNGDGYVLEMCEDLYEQAARCEKNVKDLTYQDTSGCELIHKILPSLNSAFNGMTHGGPTAAKALAWVFGFLCAFMGVYIYWLHRKVIRQKISLASLGVGDTPSNNGEHA